MTSKILFGLFCFVAFYSLFSCTKEGAPGPQGPPGDTGVFAPLMGDIIGKVIVYDTMGNPLSDYSGVQVIIDSTGIDTVTDASGNFRFNQVKAGLYNFSFKKEGGYGTYRIVHQLHPGGPQPTKLANADVGQIYNGPPVTYFEAIVLGSPSNPQVVSYMEFPSPMRVPAASVLYISNTPDLSSTNFKANIRYYTPYIMSDMWYQTPEIDPYVIRQDSTLIYAKDLYFYLAFDNLKDIHYIDEVGRVVYPCTGTKLGTFKFSGQFFWRNPFSSRMSNDGVYPLLRKHRLK
jgi:hypothetical protein